MRTVVDANILIAALIRPGGWSDRQLRRRDVEWLVPDVLIDELAEHIDELASKTGEDVAEAAARVAHRLAGIEVVPAGELVRHAEDVLVRAIERIDADDRMYGAAALAAAARFLWTRDNALLDAFEGLAVLRVPPATPLPDL